MTYFAVSDRIEARKAKALELSLKLLQRILEVDGFSFMLKDATGEEMEIIACGDKSRESAAKKIGITLEVGKRVAGRAASENKPFLIVGDINKNKEFSHLKKYEEISSGLAVPALAGDKIVGVLNAKRTSAREALRQQDLKTAGIIASVIGEELFGEEV